MNETAFLKKFHAGLIERGWLSFPQNSNIAPGSRYIPGTPDIIACAPDGTFIGFELKSPQGRLTKSQEAMLREFQARQLEAHYFVVPSDSDWELLLEQLTGVYGKAIRSK